MTAWIDRRKQHDRDRVAAMRGDEPTSVDLDGQPRTLAGGLRAIAEAIERLAAALEHRDDRS